MIRRSAVLLTQGSRTIVRDPRKTRPLPASKTPNVLAKVTEPTVPDHSVKVQSQRLPFEPTQTNQENVGSSIVSYMLAGAGMAIGFTIVGAIFGGI